MNYQGTSIYNIQLMFKQIKRDSGDKTLKFKYKIYNTIKSEQINMLNESYKWYLLFKKY